MLHSKMLSSSLELQGFPIVQFTKKQCMTEKCLHSGVLPYSMIFSWNLVMWVGARLVEGLGGWGTCFKYLFASPEIRKWQSGSSINTSTRLHNFLCAFSNKITLTILILKARRNLEITMVVD